MFELSAVTFFLAFALLVVAIVRIFYLLVIKSWNYFTHRNVVFERGLPIFGTLYRAMLKKVSIPNDAQNIYNKHSDRKFVGMFEMGGRPSYLIRDPDLLRDITIKDFGFFSNHNMQLDKELDPLFGRSIFMMSNQAWREMRSIMSPLFTGSKMKHMLTLMIDCVDDFNEFIRKEIETKSTSNSIEYNMLDLIMCLTNDIIGSTAFGVQMNTLKNPDNEFYKMGKKIAYALFGMKTYIVLAFPKLSRLLGIKILEEGQDNFFRTVIQNTVEERQKQNIVRNDMLHLLMLAREGRLNDQKDTESDQDTGFATISEIITTKTTEKLKNWTDDDLVAQSVIFFVAGFTSVSTTFCFLCHELALNPEIQNRLYEEILEMKEQLNGKQFTFEALQTMKYLDMVVSEVMRLWPVAAMMDRVASKQYVLEDHDGTKVLLQPNDLVWIPTFPIHRDPKYYPNPEVFDPERFSDENKKNIHPCTYMPFGTGPRACIATRFALLQLKTTAYHFLLNFKIECSPKTSIPIKRETGTGALTPIGGFFNQLTIRN